MNVSSCGVVCEECGSDCWETDSGNDECGYCALRSSAEAVTKAANPILATIMEVERREALPRDGYYWISLDQIKNLRESLRAYREATHEQG